MTGTPPGVPELEVVAIRTDGPHEHVSAVKLADGTTQDSATVVAAIKRHEAHYVMRRPDLPLPLLLHVRQCPDCLAEVPWA